MARPTRTLSAPDLALLRQVSRTRLDIIEAEQHLYELVRQARKDDRITWAAIGAAAGMTRQVAEHHFSKPPITSLR